MLTYILVGAFIFFGLAVTLAKDMILNGLKQGLKNREKSKKECCEGDCECNKK